MFLQVCCVVIALIVTGVVLTKLWSVLPQPKHCYANASTAVGTCVNMCVFR